MQQSAPDWVSSAEVFQRQGFVSDINQQEYLASLHPTSRPLLHLQSQMDEEYANPVNEKITKSSDAAFETEASEERPSSKKKRFQNNIKGNLKGGLDAMKDGVENMTQAAEKMGNAAHLTNVKDLMKFADLAGKSTLHAAFDIRVLTKLTWCCGSSIWLDGRGRRKRIQGAGEVAEEVGRAAASGHLGRVSQRHSRRFLFAEPAWYD